MKQRLLVMNGQRLLQTEQGGEWSTQKVEKAGALKPGIYNLFSAQKAEKSQTYTGAIVHADDAGFYQQTGRSFVVHERKNFDIMIAAGGGPKTISYGSDGKAAVSETVNLTRGRTV